MERGRSHSRKTKTTAPANRAHYSFAPLQSLGALEVRI